MNILRKAEKITVTLKNNILDNSKIFFISEPVNWVIEEICKELIKNMALSKLAKASLTYSPFFLRNKVLHFASVGAYVVDNKVRICHPSNKVVLSWYHILDNDFRIPLIPEMNKTVSVVHTACSSTKDKLIAGGFDKKKVILIPEGIDLKTFVCYEAKQKIEVRKKLNLPVDKILLGSFQKDGGGWGEGLEPKLEKGPDVFCDVVEKLAKQYDIHVVLTGPARGYVKKRLDDANISYTHRYLKNYIDVVDYYNALNLYLVTSRVEGGPKAIIESWACGVPLVTTNVGMAPDVIKDGENGFIVNVEDTDKLVQKSQEVLENKTIQEKIVAGGLKDVKKHDWSIMAEKYFNLIYKNLL